jgi:hypothetical protein
VTDYGLGRLYTPDERDAAYPMRALVQAAPPRKWRYHQTGPVLDQGGQPWCVGASWQQWLASDPVRTRNGLTMESIYRAAQEVDEWPGVNYAGTSVRAGAQVLEAAGHIESYHWAWDIATVADFVLSKGTVILGTNWYEQMSLPDKHGIIYPSGVSRGGHAYLCVGYNSIRGLFRVLNSWGESWGDKGRAWLRGEDLDRLLKEDGEACAAIERRKI